MFSQSPMSSYRFDTIIYSYNCIPNHIILTLIRMNNVSTNLCMSHRSVIYLGTHYCPQYLSRLDSFVDAAMMYIK